MPFGHGSYRIPNCRTRFDRGIDLGAEREKGCAFPIADSPILLICKELGSKGRELGIGFGTLGDPVVKRQTQWPEGLTWHHR